MPKFPPIPRLSIVIPIGRDLAAFERTLVSVLENRPTASEVIVAHDGSYDDPFDLCDEVRFATSDSCHFTDLITASVGEARGQYVHVLGDGIRATHGWTDDAMERFDHHDIGCVSPVIRDSSSATILAAGWNDSSVRLCQPSFKGRQSLPAKRKPIEGAYLQASFWRRELIRSLTDGFLGRRDGIATAYAYGKLMGAAGWQSLVATDSVVVADGETLPWETSSFGRGKQLRAIHAHFNSGGWGRSAAYAGRSLLCNLAQPGRYGEALGQAFAPLSTIGKSIRDDVVPHSDRDEVIVRMHAEATESRRQAA